MHDFSVRLAAGLALALALLLGLASAPSARAAGDLDSLNEELRVSVARLQYALDKIRVLDYPLGAADRQRRRDLIREGKYLMERSATVAWADEQTILELTDALGDLRGRVEDFVETVVPSWEKPRRDPGSAMGSPFKEVRQFHDVAQDVETRYGGLSSSEREQAKALIQQGEDLVAGVKSVKERDHVEREELLRKLVSVREELAMLAGEARVQRSPGYAFVPTHRVRAPWTQIDHRENGFDAVRVRFLPPQSAYVTLENESDERRPVFVELEFHDAAGAPTGSGNYETAPLEEMAPGEVREVLVPIFPTHPRFWQETQTFTVYLD